MSSNSATFLFSRTAGLGHQRDFAAAFVFLYVHVKMIILGSRCLTGCMPVCCYSAVGGCVMLLTECVDGRPASRLAGLQCVSGVVILVLICVGQGLVRCRHCIRHITLHSTVVPWSSGLLMFLQSIIEFQKYTHFGNLLLFQCFPSRDRVDTHFNAFNVIRHVFGLIKCSSVSQQLFREVRIMKLLNHPNIGKFKHAASWWQLTNETNTAPTPS